MKIATPFHMNVAIAKPSKAPTQYPEGHGLKPTYGFYIFLYFDISKKTTTAFPQKNAIKTAIKNDYSCIKLALDVDRTHGLRRLHDVIFT